MAVAPIICAVTNGSPIGRESGAATAATASVTGTTGRALIAPAFAAADHGPTGCAPPGGGGWAGVGPAICAASCAALSSISALIGAPNCDGWAVFAICAAAICAAAICAAICAAASRISAVASRPPASGAPLRGHATAIGTAGGGPLSGLAITCAIAVGGGSGPLAANGCAGAFGTPCMLCIAAIIAACTAGSRGTAAGAAGGAIGAGRAAAFAEATLRGAGAPMDALGRPVPIGNAGGPGWVATSGEDGDVPAVLAVTALRPRLPPSPP